jgi:protoporphyrin/coproporphyrin ferrochelatase
MVHSLNLSKAVSESLTQYSSNFLVELAMSYGEPNIVDALKSLSQAGARRLLIVPLYPQYSGTTTGSVFDGVSQALMAHRWVGDVRFVSQYYERPDYIAALAQSVRAHWQRHGRAERLMLSFHGIPKRYFDNGDLYHCHCYGTARRLQEALALQSQDVIVCFQSRVGREEWLRPYTDQTIAALGQSGVKTLDVICPGFAVDCLETLEEIAVENAGHFKAHGGQSLRYIPALNAMPEHADMLSALIMEQSQGWPEMREDYDAPERVNTRMQHVAQMRQATADKSKAVN